MVEILILVGVVVLCVVVCVGVCSGLTMLMEIQDTLISLQVSQSQTLKGLCGDYILRNGRSVADDVRSIAILAEAAKDGRIPNLRYDDWHATEEDFKRWDAATRRAAYSSG